jgi:hypothetical protein
MCAACCCTFLKVTSLIKATEYIAELPRLHKQIPPSLWQSSPEIEFSLQQHLYWYSSFAFFCALEFSFMSLSELLVLQRYLDLAFKGMPDSEYQSNTVCALENRLDFALVFTLLQVRRYMIAGCIVVCFSISSVTCASAGMVYRLQHRETYASDNWKNSKRMGDYFTAAQMLSEVIAIFIKAVSFLFISRMDLARLEKIERWTFVNLVPVPMWQILHVFMELSMLNFIDLHHNSPNFVLFFSLAVL